MIRNNFGEILEDFVEKRPQRLCLKCGKCCKKILSDGEYECLKSLASVGEIDALDFLKIFAPEEKVGEKTLYVCKHLSSKNLCEIYEKRPGFCKSFPANPWTEIPEGCGFYGWLFVEREKIMKNVRRQKEMLVLLNAEYKSAQNKDKKQIEHLIKNIQKTIESFSKYGSKDW